MFTVRYGLGLQIKRSALLLERVIHWTSKPFGHVVGFDILSTFRDASPLLREGYLFLKKDRMAETCSSSWKINFCNQRICVPCWSYCLMKLNYTVKIYYKNSREIILKLYRMRLKDVIQNRYRTLQKTKGCSVSFELGHVRHEVWRHLTYETSATVLLTHRLLLQTSAVWKVARLLN